MGTGVVVGGVGASGPVRVFKVASLGGCLEDAPILVLDYHSRSAVFKLTVEADDEQDSESTEP